MLREEVVILACVTQHATFAAMQLQRLSFEHNTRTNTADEKQPDSDRSKGDLLLHDSYRRCRGLWLDLLSGSPSLLSVFSLHPQSAEEQGAVEFAATGRKTHLRTRVTKRESHLRAPRVPKPLHQHSRANEFNFEWSIRTGCFNFEKVITIPRMSSRDHDVFSDHLTWMGVINKGRFLVISCFQSGTFLKRAGKGPLELALIPELHKLGRFALCSLHPF